MTSHFWHATVRSLSLADVVAAYASHANAYVRKPLRLADFEVRNRPPSLPVARATNIVGDVVSDARPPSSDRSSSGGLVIVDQSTGLRVMLGLAIAGALLLGAFVAAAAGAIFFTIILFLVTLVVSGFVIPRALEARVWHAAELHLPQSPLSLGSFTAAKFKRTSKRPASFDRSAQVHTELRCVESATYTVGTDTRTDTQSIFEKRQTIDGEFTSGTFTATVPIQIPVERGAPTMDLGNNEISWEIEIKGSGKALPKRGITFTLTVQPALAIPESLPQDVQDA